MTRRHFWIGLSIILVLMIRGQAMARDPEPVGDYLAAVKHYNEGRYEQAAHLFESLAGDGRVNGQLYYNTGNAWFKAGNIGRAMLWYERAVKRIPQDPDLNYNLGYVAGLVKDKVEDRESPVITVLFFWKKTLGSQTIQILAIGLFTLFWVLQIIGVLRSGRSMKLAHWLVLGLALVFILTAAYDYADARFHPRAIVLSDTVSVRSGLSEDATELFVLHSGTRVAVDDERGGYVKIRFSDDKIGWIKMQHIEII